MTIELKHISDRTIREVVAAALDRGWRFDRQGRGGHIKLVHPNGCAFVSTSKGVRGRGSRNLDATLRRIERGQT